MPAVDQVLNSNLVDVSDIARMLGTTPRSVQRWNADSANPRKDAEDRLLELDAVLRLARQVMAERAARLWLRTPNPTMGWNKPLDLVGRGDFKIVIDTLEALDEGVIS
jgi:putative toxin-antitoxin system antitoxin component (TIGR02293 family)